MESYSQSKPAAWYLSNSGSTSSPTSGLVDSGSSQTLYSGGDHLSGFKNSSHRSEISKGVNATTPLSASSSQLLLSVPTTFRWPFRFSDWVAEGSFETFAEFGDPNGADLATSDNAALTKLYNRIGSQFKGLQVLGEIGETLHMIRSPAAGARKLLDLYLIKARKVRSAAKTRKIYIEALSDLWLEFTFGWLPLAADVTAGYSAFRDVVDRDVFQSFRAHHETRTTASYFVGNFSCPGTPVAVHVSADVEYSAGVLYTGKCRLKKTVRSGFLTSTNLPDFIPAAWELCPWSFFIDYFVNVGDVLECWATAQLFDFDVLSRTTRLTSVVTTSGDPEKYTPQLGNHSDDRVTSVGTCATSVKLVSRAIPSGLSLPSLQVSSHWTAKRILNVIALFAGRAADLRFTRD